MSAIFSLTLSDQSGERLCGILLVSSLLIGVLALILLFASGASSVFSAMLQGTLAEVAPYAETYRWLMRLWTAAWVVQFAGFALLAWLLLRAASDPIVLPASSLILIATILGVLHATFNMSMTLWAADEAAQTGTIPAIYVALDAWIENGFRLAYIAHLAGTAGFGLAILRAGFLDLWVGWLAIGWSVLWLLGYVISVGAPGVVFVVPAVIGAALLWQ